MRKALLALTLVTALAACSKDAPMSEEEIYLMDAYARISGAFSYDVVCAGDTISKGDPTLLAANMNMIATLVYQGLRANHPDTSDKELQTATINAGDGMRQTAGKMLKDKGCDAAEVKAFKEAYDRFTTVGPDDNYTFMLQDMNKRNIARKSAILTPITSQGPQNSSQALNPQSIDGPQSTPVQKP